MLFSFVRYRLQYARQFAQLIGVQPDAADRVPVMGGQHPCAGAVSAVSGNPAQAHMPAGGTGDHVAPSFDLHVRSPRRLQRMPPRISGTAAHRWNMRPGAAVQYA